MIDFEKANTLFCYHGHKRFYGAPPISENMVVCGPFVEPGDENGVLRVKTSFGGFDLSKVVSGLPPGRFPSAIFIRVDGSGSVLPTGLGNISVPKFLLIGDTHHMENPITKVVNYLKSASYNYLITYNNRHHAHFLAAAGLKNIYWVPGPTVTPFKVAQPFKPQREIVFVGGVGKTHVRRRMLLEALAASNIPVRITKGYGEEAAALYASYAGSLNCSLNGDLNMRVFEVLSAGGCLITDRLSSLSGLDRILTEDEHYLAFSSIDELVEKCKFVLENPDEAAAIARRGKAHFDASLSLENAMRYMARLAYRGEIDDLIRVDDPRLRPIVKEDSARLAARISIYEILQELRGDSEKTRVFIDRSTPFDVVEDITDLQRMEIGIDLLAAAKWPRIGETLRKISGAADVRWLTAEEARAEAETPGGGWDLVLTSVADIEKRIAEGSLPEADRYLICDMNAVEPRFGEALLARTERTGRLRHAIRPVALNKSDQSELDDVVTEAPSKAWAMVRPAGLGLRDPKRLNFAGGVVYDSYENGAYQHTVFEAKHAGDRTFRSNLIFKIQRYDGRAALEVRKNDIAPNLRALWSSEDVKDRWGPYLRIFDAPSETELEQEKMTLRGMKSGLDVVINAVTRLAPVIVEEALSEKTAGNRPGSSDLNELTSLASRISDGFTARADDQPRRGHET